MDNKLKIFENKEFGKVRVQEINGQPYFVGNDIASILGYRNTRDASLQHVDEEDKISDVAFHDGRQNRKMVVINESGLYSLILSSKLPEYIPENLCYLIMLRILRFKIYSKLII